MNEVGSFFQRDFICSICLNQAQEHNRERRESALLVVPKSVSVADIVAQMEKPKSLGEDYILCDICYEEKKLSEFFGLSCDHKFCKGCLEGHLGTNIENG